MNIKKSMKIAMAQCGINQQELAVASGVSEETLSRISQNKGNPSLETINKIAKATDYTLGEFIALDKREIKK